MANDLWDHVTELVKRGLERIHKLRALVEEARAGAKQRGAGLLIFGFRLDKTHFGTLNCNNDGLGISRIVRQENDSPDRFFARLYSAASQRAARIVVQSA